MDFRKRKINLLESQDKEEIEDLPEEIIVSEPKKQPSEKEYTHKASESPKKAPRKKGSGKRKIFSCFFILLIIFFTFVTSVLSADNDSFLAGVKNSYLMRQITNIISPEDKYLAGEKDDRINFLLLGMGGEGHDGPYLTDTIIVASFKPSTKEAALFSLPRDMIVPLSINDYRKINSIYTIGERKEGTTGGDLMKEIVGDTLNMDIHYFAAVDFKGFIELVDAVGGLEISVDRSFTDYQFPTADYKYQVVSFKEGEQIMDGLTALRYVRSRHGNNGEGSDFARIKRQQKVILAAKEKLTSFNTLINPQKITSMFNLFNKYTKTDLEPWEAVKLVHMGKSLNTNQIASQSIDDGPGGYLKSGIALDGAYILQPVTGNYDQIRSLVHNIFDLIEVPNEKARIIVQNGTTIPGLALKAVNYLEQMGYDVVRYGNAESQNMVKTKIYSYNEIKLKTKSSLEKIFQIKSSKAIPENHSAETIAKNWQMIDDAGNYEQIDFVIMLGLDQQIDETKEIVKTIEPQILNNSSTSSSTEEGEDQ